MPLFGPGSFDLPDPSVGLSALSSYQATLTVTFDGTKDEQPLTWTLTETISVSSDPVARMATQEQTGTATKKRYSVEVAGTRYERTDQGPCTASAASVDSTATSAVDEPASLLSGFFGAEEKANEPVDGVPATDYGFDERAFGSVDPATSSGDVWIATDGGYVLRYSSSTDGSSAFLGSGVTGRLTMEYRLTAVNQPVAISVPTECPAGLVDAPLLPDAADPVSVPGEISYTTESAMADVNAFYAQQLVATGWQQDGDTLTDDAGTQSVATFIRGAETLSVVATATAAGADVALFLDRQQS